MADCTDCKWWMSIDRHCLLARVPEQCSRNPARRGDDELVNRVLDLADEQREGLKRRLKHVDHDAREINMHKNPEWE